MSKALELTGKRFGRLVVISREPSLKISERHTVCRWLCQCDCGNTIVTRSGNLSNGCTRSCGCLQKELTAKRATTHGMSKNRLYTTWLNMRRRCNDPNFGEYRNYGGRGIKVCKEWNLSFEAFKNWALKSGYQDNLTIERKNVNDNYCPNNCCWITRKEQGYNKTTSSFLTYNNETKTIAEWAECSGMKYDTLFNRIKYLNWPIEKALTQPVKTKK